jgi:glucoamylase
VTTNGPLSSEPYYLRITANGDADSGAQIQISDGGPLVDQRRVVDPSFREVVRLGVKSALDPKVRSSLPVVDRELRYQTANGQFIRLASSIDAGRPVETPTIVACRYHTTLCP